MCQMCPDGWFSKIWSHMGIPWSVISKYKPIYFALNDRAHATHTQTNALSPGFTISQNVTEFWKITLMGAFCSLNTCKLQSYVKAPYLSKWFRELCTESKVICWLRWYSAYPRTFAVNLWTMLGLTQWKNMLKNLPKMLPKISPIYYASQCSYYTCIMLLSCLQFLAFFMENCK